MSGGGWHQPLDEVAQNLADVQSFLDAANAVPYGLEHRRALPPGLFPAAPPVETAAALRERDRAHVMGSGEVMCWCRPFRHGTSWIHLDPRVPMGHGIIVPLEGGYPMGGKPNPGTKKDKRLKKNKKKR